MGHDRSFDHSGYEPGEWLAIAEERVIAHGFDFHDVADEACTQADDIAFERVPPDLAPSPPPESLRCPSSFTPAFPVGRRARGIADATPHRAEDPLPSLR